MTRAGQPKLVTVFGGSGFIGRYLVQKLAKTGAIVRVAVRRPERAHFLKPLGNVGQIVPFQANVRDDASVAAAVEGADWVISLPGILAPGGKQTFEAVQHEGPARIARAAAAAGAERLLLMSAIGADPDSPAEYGRTKAKGEAAAREAFPGTTILRPSIVIGPEDGFFNLFAGMAKIAPALPLIGGGDTRFQPVYVGDVAEAGMRCLQDPETAGKTYELGGPKIYNFRQLMELMLQEIGRKRILMPIPWEVAMLQGGILEKLPKPLLTRDQVKLLQRDNVVADGASTFADLGIEPDAIETILPDYLWRYRPGGRWFFKMKRKEAGKPA